MRTSMIVAWKYFYVCIYWSISSSVQVWNDDVLDEPLVREDEVVAVGVEEYELAGLVEGPQAYPVLEVDRRLP